MTDHMDHNVEMDAAMALTDAADRIALESPDNAAAVNRFVRGDTVRWDPIDEDTSAEFQRGYQRAIGWLRTRPPLAEAEEIVELYRTHQPGHPCEESTVFVDASKVPTLVAYLGADIEVEDGAVLKYEFVRDYGAHLEKTFNPPWLRLMFRSTPTR